LRSTVAEDKTVSATIDGTAVTQTATVTVTAGAVSADQSTISANPTSMVASSGTSTITVAARDGNGNPIPGLTVVLAATGSGNTLTQPGSPTDASGQTTGTLRSTVAEDKTVSATIDGTAVTQTATVTVTAGGVDADQSAISANPTSMVASSGTSTITVTQPGSPTDASGQATGTLRSTVAEDKTVSATIDGTAVTQMATVTVTPGPATQLTISAGQDQTATVNTPVAVPPAVIVRDAFDNPVAGVSVTFTVTSGGGSLTGANATTDASGIAAVSSWTLGTAAGTGNNRVEAASPGLSGSPVTFVASATAGPATQIAIQAGNNQTATVNTAVAILPAVIVSDAFNNPVAGVSVSFAVTLGGGSVTGADATTGTNGIARVGSWTLGTVAGTNNNTLTATAAGLSGSPVTFTASATPGGATQLVFTSQPSDVLARATITPTVVVTAQDAFGNTATGFAGVVSGAIGTNPPGNGTLSGTTARAAVSGVATFADLSIDQAGTGYTLTATAAGPSSATSAPFDVTLQLVFTVQPSTVLAGAAISPAVRVAARDGLDNTVTSFTGDVTVAIAPGTGTPGATLSGTTTVGATAGEATFVDLSIDFGGGGLGPGSGYRLTATASGLSSATSVEFTVSLRLVFMVQPTTTANGAVIAPAIQVAAQGAMGRTDTSFAGFLTMHIAPGTGAAGATLGGTRTVAAVRGIATFTDLSIDLAATGYQLRATGVGFLGDGYSDPFDITCTSDCWTTRAPMPTARSDLGVGVVNGILYAVGGVGAVEYATVEAYDPVSDSWTTKAPMPASRQTLAVGVVNGILYAVGGFSGTWLATVEAYDPVSNSWTPKAPMPTARGSLGVAVVNGILYAIGGSNASGALTTVEAYDPVTNTWTTKSPMPTARFRLGVGVVNGIVYAVRGNPGFYTVEAYDPATDSWTPRANAPTFRQEFGAGVVNGILYAVGGFNNSTVEAYDPMTDNWSPRAALSAPRSSAGVGIVNGVLYAVGGYDTAAVARVEAYRP
jgi:N-acetylneuraminic acid mutarotase